MLNSTIQLSNGEVGKNYIIKNLNIDDSELESFLLTLGCYENEQITIVSALHNNFIVSIKDARYSIDFELAQAIDVIEK